MVDCNVRVVIIDRRQGRRNSLKERCEENGLSECQALESYQGEKLKFDVAFIHVGNQEYVVNNREIREPVEGLWEAVGNEQRIVVYTGDRNFDGVKHPPEFDHHRIAAATKVADAESFFIEDFVEECKRTGQLPAAEVFVKGCRPRAYEAKLKVLYALLDGGDGVSLKELKDAVKEFRGRGSGYVWEGSEKFREIEKQFDLLQRFYVDKVVASGEDALRNSDYVKALVRLRNAMLDHVEFPEVKEKR